MSSTARERINRLKARVGVPVRADDERTSAKSGVRQSDINPPVANGFVKALLAFEALLMKPDLEGIDDTSLWAQLVALVARDPDSLLAPVLGWRLDFSWADAQIVTRGNESVPLVELWLIRNVPADVLFDPDYDVGAAQTNKGRRPTADFLFDLFMRRSDTDDGNVVRALLADRRIDMHIGPVPDHFIIGASRRGHANVVRALLADDRFDPQAEDNFPISVAAENGHTDVVVALLTDKRPNSWRHKRADPTTYSNYPIRIAAKSGYGDIVRALLTDGRAEPRAKSNEAISVASKFNHPDIVLALVNSGRVNPAVVGNKVIKRASKRGDTAVVAALLNVKLASNRFVDPAATDNYSIRWAVRNFHNDIVRALLKDGRANPTVAGNYPIRTAAAMGNFDIVEALLADSKRRVNPEWRVNPAADDNSAIRLAAFNNHPKVVVALLDDERVSEELRKTREGQERLAKYIAFVYDGNEVWQGPAKRQKTTLAKSGAQRYKEARLARLFAAINIESPRARRAE